MKKIKIFLASSIKEFADERMSLKNFTRQMENVLVDHDIAVKMFICEFADNSVADGKKQDDFSREIDDSDIVFFLAGKRFGEFTLEEYNYALETLRKRSSGTILACFKICDEVEQSVKDFSQNLYADAVRVDFSNTAELKSALASVIGKMVADTVSIQLQDGKVIIAGKAVKL